MAEPHLTVNLNSSWTIDALTSSSVSRTPILPLYETESVPTPSRLPIPSDVSSSTTIAPNVRSDELNGRRSPSPLAHKSEGEHIAHERKKSYTAVRCFVSPDV